VVVLGVVELCVDVVGMGGERGFHGLSAYFRFGCERLVCVLFAEGGMESFEFFDDMSVKLAKRLFVSGIVTLQLAEC